MDKETDPQLHVPEPAIRPGDTPDFSHVEIPRAGEVRRPDPGENPQEMRDLAFSIIRVLNRKGEAVGPWADSLSDEALQEGLRHMMTLRAYDARMLKAQRQGKTSFYMQHLGEEAIACAFQKALRKGDMLTVCGSLQSKAWTDKDGNERTGMQVVADQIVTARKPKKRPPSDY